MEALEVVEVVEVVEVAKVVEVVEVLELVEALEPVGVVALPFVFSLLLFLLRLPYFQNRTSNSNDPGVVSRHLVSTLPMIKVFLVESVMKISPGEYIIPGQFGLFSCGSRGLRLALRFHEGTKSKGASP